MKFWDLADSLWEAASTLEVSRAHSWECAPGMVGQGPYFPVPESWTVCVPTASLTLKVAERAPVAVGVKLTVIVQSQPGLRLDPQFDDALKSPGSVPPSVMLVISSVVV